MVNRTAILASLESFSLGSHQPHGESPAVRRDRPPFLRERQLLADSDASCLPLAFRWVSEILFPFEPGGYNDETAGT